MSFAIWWILKYFALVLIGISHLIFGFFRDFEIFSGITWYQSSISVILRYFEVLISRILKYFGALTGVNNLFWWFWCILRYQPSNFLEWSNFELFWVCISWYQPSNCKVLANFEALTGINRVFCYLVNFEVFWVSISWY